MFFFIEAMIDTILYEEDAKNGVKKRDKWFVSCPGDEYLFPFFEKFEQIFEKPYHTAQERTMALSKIGIIAGCFGTPFGAEMMNLLRSIEKASKNLLPKTYEQKKPQIMALLAEIQGLNAANYEAEKEAQEKHLSDLAAHNAKQLELARKEK